MQVSVVGFGGIPIQGVETGTAERIVGAAVDAGITFFDSARGYTDSEEKLGAALASRRSQVVLATKSMARDAAAMSADIDKSLRLLRTDHIDVYQIHNPSTQAQIDQVLGPGGALEALRAAQQAGKVRFVGITGHSRELLCQAMRSGAFETVQHPLNPLEPRWQEDVVPMARRLQIGTIAMKPLAGGAFCKVSDTSLRWCLHHGADVVIPGMDTAESVAENARVGQLLRPPSKEEMAKVEEEMARWEGVFCRRCGYCLPCPNGLNIPFLLLIEAYYERYGLKAWALERLAGLDKKFVDCVGCGECQARCPYELPVPQLMPMYADKVR